MTSLTPNEIKVLNTLLSRTHPKFTLGDKLQAIIAVINESAGEKGATGDKGPVGDKGPTGDQGPQGDQGLTGLQGLYTGVPTGTPVNAVAASKVLSITGVVLNGETVTVDGDVFEFHTTDTYEGENIGVDISANATKSKGTLTVGTQPTSVDTLTIGTKVYTFVPAGTANADGEISVGTGVVSARNAIVAAINGTDGHNTPHPDVVAAAFSSSTCEISAKIGGVAGDAIVTTETFISENNFFDAGTLGTTTPGTNCSAGNAITALAAKVLTDGNGNYTLTDGTGDTMDCTSVTKGVVGNDIDIAETLSNGAWAAGAVKLSGGINGTIGEDGKCLKDSSYLYIAIAENTISDDNWRRISVGSKF